MSPARWVLLASCALACAARPVPFVLAQASSEVIEDPELAGSPPSDAGSSTASGEVIEDPELANAPPSDATSGSNTSSGSSGADVRLVLHMRLSRDLREEDPREEVWDSTTVAALDATLRRSDSLRFALGLVARYRYSRLARAVSDARADRYEFDVLPSAGYVDGSISSGLHLRAGYQPVHLGRFDVFSATNVLSISDLRSGLSTLPELGEIAQFAARLDYAPVGWFALQLIYIPFFTPHLVSVSEGDYALLRSSQAQVDAVFNDNGILSPNLLRGFVASNLSRQDRERLAETGLDALAPSPTFAHPQAALRASAHGPAGELALTFSSALEHIPAFRVSDSLLNPSSAASNMPDLRPLRVEYNRFAVISADGAIDLPPFSIGLELAYSFHRTFYAVGVADADSPYAVPIPDFSDVAQVGARIEYLQSSHWLFALEAYGAYAMSTPRDPQRGWLFMQGEHYLYGAGGAFGYRSDFGLSLQLAAAVLSGPSWIVGPRIAYALFEPLELELGALFVEGRAPPVFATPNVSFGGLYSNVDQVFFGLRCKL